MPGMDGLTALKEIKKIDSNAKIIMCSSVNKAVVIVEAIKAGAKDFVIKPVEPKRLFLAINKVTGNYTTHIFKKLMSLRRAVKPDGCKLYIDRGKKYRSRLKLIC